MKEYKTSEYVSSVLAEGKILAPGENPQEMFDRVTNTLFAVEETFGTPPRMAADLKELFAGYFADKYFSPGTPTMTNAGRHNDAALSSCVVIPVDLRDKETATSKIRDYYKQNMGSGFDFSPYADPVEMLQWLNEFSASETATGNYDRYIGNMGNLRVSHSKIREFIRAKKEQKLIHFNISVDVDETFMNSAIEGKSFELSNGNKIDARALLEDMAEYAWLNGDPGIIYLDRMNRDNPVELISAYTSTPPCAEMGLAPGETCQFGYINLSKFATLEGIDYPQLAQATTIMTRALDNAIEISRSGFPHPESLRLADLKRKIGIGVCGLADALAAYNISYASEEARILARDILSFINYNSKLASVKLAQERGACGAMMSFIGNKYYDRFLENKYSIDTNTVSAAEWSALGEHIRETGQLRNILTTALPPTGRASILMEVTSSIEPKFEEATKIHPFDHLRMVAALCGPNGVYDEAASKTVNLHRDSTVQDVLDIFVFAHQLGLKNISVYRDGSRANQQMQL